MSAKTIVGPTGVPATMEANIPIAVNHTHYHSRWCSLATDVTDTEEQFFVTDKVVIEVASHFTCRFQETSHL